jgi:hypothetical protein
MPTPRPENAPPAFHIDGPRDVHVVYRVENDGRGPSFQER